jgi:uncharacterized repeat protein (TIGR02543 family)
MLYAHWVGLSCRLRFEVSGGVFVDLSLDSARDVTYGEVIGGVFPVPTRSGYGFNGWYTLADGYGTRYTNGSVYEISGDGTLYAYWVYSVFTVVFELNGGYGVSPAAVSGGSPVVEPLPVPIKGGYTFVGWYKDASLLTLWDFGNDLISKDTTLYACWDTNSYCVSFHSNAIDATGSIMDSAFYKYGLKYKLPINTYNRGGYHFGGWSLSSIDAFIRHRDGDSVMNLSLLSDTLDFYVVWVPDTFELVFDLDVGSGVIVPELLGSDTLDVVYGRLLGRGVPLARRSGYLFLGWYEYTGGTGKRYADTSVYRDATSVRVYAMWSVITDGFTVHLDFEGGHSAAQSSFSASAESSIGTLLSYGCGVPLRAGYTFMGYYASRLGIGKQYFKSDGSAGATATVWDKGSAFTLYAHWLRNSYYVYYDLNGGTGAAVSSVHVYDSLSSLRLNNNNYNRVGYTFSGWDTLSSGLSVVYADGSSVLNLSGVSGGIDTLYAVWVPVVYRVHYVSSGGIGTMLDQLLVYGVRSTLSPCLFTRSGYVVLGWSKDTSYGRSVIDYSLLIDTLNLGFTADSVVTLYAMWSAQRYTLSYDEGGSKEVRYDSIVGALPVPQKVGYGFNGWYTMSGGYGTRYTDTTKYDNAGDLLLHAYWLWNTFTVTFSLDGGIGVSPVAVSGGVAVSRPLNVPTRAGYTFVDWYHANLSTLWDFSDVINSDTTIYAKWLENSYVISYEFGAVGVTGLMAYHRLNYTQRDTLRRNVFERVGYIFVGWAYGEGGWQVFVDGDSVLTGLRSGQNDTVRLYGLWHAESYRLILRVNKGSGTSVPLLLGSDTLLVTYGSVIGVLPGAVRSGYSFVGWYPYADGSGQEYRSDDLWLVSHSDTVYAKWVSDIGSVLVTLNGQGATTHTYTSVSATLDAPIVNLNASTDLPTRIGYTFGGYYVEPSGVGVKYYDSIGRGVGLWDRTESFTLYAAWLPNSYLVVYLGNGSTGDTTLPSVHSYGGLESLCYNGFTRTGYTFLGWSVTLPLVSHLGGQSVSHLTTGSDTVYLYAVWTNDVTYKIVFDGNSTIGSTVAVLGVDSIRVVLDKYIGVLPLSTRSGYSFSGWWSADSGVRYDASTVWRWQSDVTVFYAHWDACRYLVTLNLQGGIGGIGAVLALFDSVSLPSVGAVPTRAGYRFSGYYSLPSGLGDCYYDDLLVSQRGWSTPSAGTLYAHWVAYPYYVKYECFYLDAIGSMSVEAFTYDSLQRLSTNAYARVGYKFIGWTLDSSMKVVSYADSEYVLNLSSLVGDTVVLYALFSPLSYEIYLDGCGGVGGTSVVYGTLGSLLPSGRVAPVRAGYAFDGYWDNVLYDGERYYDGNMDPRREWSRKPLSGLDTLYGKWSAIGYTITFDAQGGSWYNYSVSVTYNDTISGDLMFTVRAGYTFIGWYTPSDALGGLGYEVKAGDTFRLSTDITLLARWQPYSYEVLFRSPVLVGVSEMSGQTFEYGSAQYLRANEYSRVGYLFGGWSVVDGSLTWQYVNGASFDSLVSHDKDTVVLYVSWLSMSSIVHLDSVGGHGGTSTVSVVYGDTLPSLSLAPYRRGYTFVGYFDLLVGGVAYYSSTLLGLRTWDKVSTDPVLYAHWIPLVDTITFVRYGGSQIDPKEVFSGETIGIVGASPLRAGYRFQGWSLIGLPSPPGATDYALSDLGAHPLLSPSTFIIDTNMYWYAIWLRNRYSVEFVPNGRGDVSGSMDAQALMYNIPSTLSVNQYSRAGYTYVGWNTDSLGLGASYSNGALVSTLTTKHDSVVHLYGQWLSNVYTLSFDKNDPPGVTAFTPESSRAVRYDSAVGILPVPRATGYGFGGWYTAITAADMSCQTSCLNDVTPSGTRYTDTTLYRVPYNTTLHAWWRYGYFTLIFESNGGLVGYPLAVKSGDSIVAPNPAPTRVGYTFAGWYTDNGVWSNAWQFLITRLDKDTTLYAKWNVHSYNISYGGNMSGGGTMSPSNSIAYDSVFTLPANAYTRAGYHFKSWNTHSDGSGISYVDGASVVGLSTVNGGDVPLYAQWEGDVYTLTFDGNEGSSYGSSAVLTRYSQSVRYATLLDSLPFATRDNYRLVGWSDHADGLGAWYTEDSLYREVTGITLYAQWSASNHRVVFVSNGGSALSDTVVTYGTHIYPVPPTRTGYDFDGWYTEATLTTMIDLLTYVVESPSILYAGWSAITYRVVYHGNGPVSDTTSPSVHSYNTKSPLTSNGYKRTGYTFMNWSVSSDGLGAAYTDGLSVLNLTEVGNSEVHLYAMWVASSSLYKLYFDAGLGSTGGVDSMYVVYDSKVGTLPLAVRTGYSFLGWYSGLQGLGEHYLESTVYVADSSTRLYAYWQSIAYRVTFDKQGGEGGINDVMAFYDSVMPFAGSAPVRTGYKFMGYFERSEGLGMQYYDSLMLPYGGSCLWNKAGNSILYALWQKNRYRVHFDANTSVYEGTMSDELFVYGEAKSLPLNAFTRAGYHFVGWGRSADTAVWSYTDGALVLNLTPVADTVLTFYVLWSSTIYDVSLDMTGGSGGFMSVRASYGYPMPNGGSVPSRTGYTFAGYNDSAAGNGTLYYDASMLSAHEWNKSTLSNVLYAQWTANTYLVSFNVNGGAPLPAGQESGSFTYNTRVQSLPTPVRAGNTFLGWYTSYNASLSVGDTFRMVGDVEVFARWQAWRYTVDFNANVASGQMPAQTFTYGSPQYLRPNAFTRIGNTFIGWGDLPAGPVKFMNGELIDTLLSSDNEYINLYALWLPSQYKVVLNKSGGTGGSDTVVATYGERLPATAVAPYRRGYLFSAYADEQSTYYAGASMTPIDTWTRTDAAPVIYAQWLPKEDNVVRFELYGSPSHINSQSGVVSGTTPDESLVPTPLKEGYTFLGWSLQPITNGYVSYATEVAITPLGRVIVDTSITIYAAWLRHTYTIQYNINGGSGGSMSLQAFVYDVKQPLFANAFYRTGYSFIGWNTLSTGRGQPYANADSVQNVSPVQGDVVNFYAQWVIDTFSVVCNIVENEEFTTLRIIYGDTVPHPGTPERKGFDFVAWREQSGRYWNFHYDQIISDTVLIAEWVNVPARLDSLWISVGGEIIDIGFHKDITNYKVELPCDTARVYINARSNDAILAYYYKNAPTIQTSLVITEPGTTVYVIRAVIAGYDSKDYTIEFTRRFQADVVKRYNDNILAVNLNPETNGHYEFLAYEWYKDGVSMGLTDAYLYLDKLADGAIPGNYSVLLHTQLGIYFSCELRGVYSINAAQLAAYPNPSTSGSLTVDYAPLSTGEKIALYNLSGALVRTFVASGKQTEINLKGLPQGTYVLKVKNKTMTVVVK